MNDLRDQLCRLTSLEGCPPGAFDAGSSPLDPTTLFREWFSSAVADGLPEPHAMWSVPAFVDSRLSREFVNISES
jgi:hypothetical protein